MYSSIENDTKLIYSEDQIACRDFWLVLEGRGLEHSITLGDKPAQCNQFSLSAMTHSSWLCEMADVTTDTSRRYGCIVSPLHAPSSTIVHQQGWWVTAWMNDQNVGRRRSSRPFKLAHAHVRQEHVQEEIPKRARKSLEESPIRIPRRSPPVASRIPQY